MKLTWHAKHMLQLLVKNVAYAIIASTRILAYQASSFSRKLSGKAMTNICLKALMVVPSMSKLMLFSPSTYDSQSSSSMFAHKGAPQKEVLVTSDHPDEAAV
ncbi:MAG TPA: hypothetical protein VEF04_07920 [Blastocatellia bacterium]|nr:hypothetical protein [Blastocatellia bacterium]